MTFNEVVYVLGGLVKASSPIASLSLSAHQFMVHENQQHRKSKSIKMSTTEVAKITTELIV